MSINVTVNGNPVKIHKGKMVISESSKEFDKRRKIRLQQVRQQSKELAASVRNNVKKVKNKQQTEFEKQSQTRLKEWQNKKMLQLQHQYESNLQDLGMGQKEAMRIEQEESEIIERERCVNELRASRRGQIAQEMLQVEKNRANLRKAIPRQTKQIAREIENARAAMVVEQASRRTPKKKKKKVTKGNFTIIQEDSDAFPDRDDEEDDEGADRRRPSRSKPPCGSLKSPSKNLSVSKASFKEHEEEEEGNEEKEHIVIQNSVLDVEKITTIAVNEVQDVHSRSRIIRSPKKKPRHELPESLVSVLSVEVPPDTRISDRIRNRHLPSAAPTSMSDILEVPSSTSSNSQFKGQEDKENREHPTRLTRATHQGISIPPSQATHLSADIIACPMCTQNANPLSHTCRGMGVSHCTMVPSHGQTHECQPPPMNVCPNARTSHTSHITDIPCKPSVSIVPETYQPQFSRLDVASTQQYRRVKSYDHGNRFASNYITDTSHVQRIHRDDLVYGEDSDGEAAGGSQKTGRTGQMMKSNEFTKMADERAKMADVRGKKALEREKIHKDYEHLMRKLPILQKQERISNLNPAKDKFHMSDDRRKEQEKNRQHELEHAFERLVPTRITLPPRGKSKRSPERTKALPATEGPSKANQDKEGKIKSAGTWRSKTNAETSNDGNKGNLFDLLNKLKNQKEELLKECKDLPQDSNFYNLIDELDFVTRSKHRSKDKIVQTDAGSSSRNRQRSTSNMVQLQKQVLILQNTSTQTSPKVTAAPTAASLSSESSDSAEPPSKQPKTTVPKKDKNVCDCKDRDKLCEILIKIRDGTIRSESDPNDLPEVVLRSANRLEDALNLETASPRKTPRKPHKQQSSSKSSSKSVSPKRSRSESPKKSPRKAQSPKKVTQKQPTRNKLEVPTRKRHDSWKHQLTTSSTRPNEEITSSTSYYSPPDYNQQQGGVPKPRNQSGNVRTVPVPQQQENLLDPTVLFYINKLLEMSKGKLDSLAANVTSVSDVPTPSSSVINATTNRPRRPVVQAAHDNGNDSTHIEKLSSLLKHFNLTPGDLNSFVSMTTSISSAPRTRTNSMGSSRSDNAQVPMTIGAHAHLTLENYTQTSDGGVTDQMVGQFAQWAEICQERISNLAAMIDQVRMEKQQMLPSPQSNQNHSGGSLPDQSTNATTYLKLPPRPMSSSPPNRSMEQKQLDSKLLDVQDGTTSRTVSRDPNAFQQLLESSKGQPDLDRDIVERYMQLIDVELKAQRAKSPDHPKEQKSVAFTPMLDIPKLPKFQPQHPSTSTLDTKIRKPPVTSNALRFNDIIHELSMIPEAENSRLSKSPQSRKSASPQKRLTTTKQKSPAGTGSKSLDKVAELSTDSPSTDRSNETVESMLKNIGLSWAIPAVKKMNAANANSSSSSSSLDIDMKKFSFLLGRNGSTSTEKSNVSPFAELSRDLSRQHRTSTPVQTTNTNSSKKSNRLISSGESEISPVAGCSDRTCKQKSKSKSPSKMVDPSFNTLPTHSINEDSDS